MTHAPSFLSAVRPTFPDRSSPLHFLTRPQLLTRLSSLPAGRGLQ